MNLIEKIRAQVEAIEKAKAEGSYQPPTRNNHVWNAEQQKDLLQRGLVKPRKR